MKVLILACLVALALARENAESLSSSEQKLEKFKHEEQQQREDERQDKIHPFLQPQPLVYSYPEPIPYTVFPQNVLPLAQPAMVLPFLQPEIMEVPKAKETMLPKRKVMPILKSPVVPFMERQILSPFALQNMHFPLPLHQPFVHQVPQLLPQTPMIPPQSLPSLPQPKVLTFPQQMVLYPQRDMSVQALLPYQEPLLDSTQEFYPVTQPHAPVSNPIFV
ncbi:hypothetical protein MC885_011655 [Smutsia gigantea]|nr:hypothetical protein MC885_011655 [Smutsia gigantea]